MWEIFCQTAELEGSVIGLGVCARVRKRPGHGNYMISKYLRNIGRAKSCGFVDIEPGDFSIDKPVQLPYNRRQVEKANACTCAARA